VIGITKPLQETSTLPSDEVLKLQTVTHTSDSVKDASRKDGTCRPSGSQQLIYLQDESMPVGDACREDGTLKEASEIMWLNSPSEENRCSKPNKKRSQSRPNDLEYPDSPLEENGYLKPNKKQSQSHSSDLEYPD
jgi:hypothetical protein